MTPRLLALRRASVVLLVLWTAVLVGTFFERRYRQAPAPEPAEEEPAAKGDQGQPIRVHKGFVYSDTLGIEPNFRIAAREAVEFTSGWYEFRDVQVSLYHEGRVAYGLVADRLRFNPVTHEAETSGRAEVSLQGGVVLRAAGFKLGGRERLLESRGPATFAGPGWGGLAGSALCSLANDTIELAGGVSVTWRGSGRTPEPTIVLLARTLRYDRKTATVVFDDGMTVLRGRMQARTAQAELQLSGPEGELRTATLAGPVAVTGVLDDGSDMDASAGTTTVASIPGGRYQLTAAGAADTGWVTVSWADRHVGWRQLTTWRLVGEGSRTAWEWLEGQGLACAREIMDGAEPRSLAADRMRLVFEGGQASSVLADGSVRVDTGDQWAVGDKMQVALATRTFVLKPAAQKRVELGAPGALAWCDRLEGSEGGDIAARGQVTGAIERASAGRTAVPIRFAASSATASRDGSHLILEGDARLWQGERVVRADRLDYDRAKDIVTGEGGVLTTARAVSASGKPSDVEVQARTLRYDRPAGIATYEGDVTLDDGQARASCQSLVATMDANGNIELANLDGGVTVRDLASARVLSGQKARMLVADGLFEIWGKPVLVKGPGGDQVKADHLEWHRASNTVVVLGAEDNPSETLYHPHQPTPTPGAHRRQP